MNKRKPHIVVEFPMVGTELTEDEIWERIFWASDKTAGLAKDVYQAINENKLKTRKDRVKFIKEQGIEYHTLANLIHKMIRYGLIMKVRGRYQPSNAFNDYLNQMRRPFRVK